MLIKVACTSAIALAAVFISGCETPLPAAHRALDAQAKMFAPNPDSANVYVYRNETLGAAIRMPIAVDGQELGITRGYTYLFVRLKPGKHTIYTNRNPSTSITLEVEAAKNYFVWQEVKHPFGSFTYFARLHKVDEKTGQEGVNECELAPDAQ